MIRPTIQEVGRICRLLFGVSVLATIASTSTVSTVVQAQALDTADYLRLARMTLALAEESGAGGRSADSAAGEPSSRPVATPGVTFEV
jgi:hypothetical protein